MTQNVILHGQRGRLTEAPRLFFMANQVLAVALSGWFLPFLALKVLVGHDVREESCGPQGAQP